MFVLPRLGHRAYQSIDSRSRPGVADGWRAAMAPCQECSGKMLEEVDGNLVVALCCWRCGIEGEPCSRPG